MNREYNSNKKKNSNKGKLLKSVIVLLAVIALIFGVTYAWFFNQMDMATLFTVQSPSDISILGPGGSEMASLDLKYTANEKVENKVTIRRVICVQSAAELHQLEIVHTTNMKDLTFNLYPASAVDDTMVNTTVTDGGFSYKYNPDHKISGKYINVNNMNNGYNYASASYHEKNYGEYKNVQSHAEPVYWLASNKLQVDKNNKVAVNETEMYRTYYVCEISWTETTKETDIFYILAQNAS